MKDNIEKRVIGLFFLMLVILSGVAYYAVQTIRAAQDKTDWVNHVHAVLLDANLFTAHLHAGDAAMSQFILAGDKRDQEKYRTEYGEMKELLLNAADMTRRDPSEEAQHRQFLKLTNSVTAHINFTRDLVHARDTGGVDAARQLLQSHPDGESTTEIDRIVAGINNSEESDLRQRDQEARDEAIKTRYVIYSGVVVNFVLLVFVSVLIRSDLNSRRIAATALEDANAKLEAKVQERTAELVKSNQALKKENLERRWSFQALDHQFRYNQLIVNAISEMVFVVSKVLNVSRVNPSVTQVTGWQPEELIAQSIERVLQLAPDGGTNPIIAALNDGREIQERPVVLITKGGASIPARYNLVPLRDDNKVVGGVVTVRPVQTPPPKV